MYCRNCGNEMDNGAAICLKCGVEAGTGVKFCVHCGNEINEKAKVCVKCGYAMKTSPKDTENDNDIFCTNCGKPMKEHQEICLSCGAKNGSAKKYCRNCGAEIREGAEICLGCGCEIKTAPQITAPDLSSVTDKLRNIDTDKIKDTLKNVNVDKIKDGINNMNTDAITEHKYAKYFGLAGGALMIISYILPFFTIGVDLGAMGKTAAYNGFTIAFGGENGGFNFFFVLPLLLVVFLAAAQFVKQLAKLKAMSSMICGAGSLVSLIIAAFMEKSVIKTPDAAAMFGDSLKINASPALGFFISLIIAAALGLFGLIMWVKKK